jgi:hypothetical protein
VRSSRRIALHLRSFLLQKLVHVLENHPPGVLIGYFLKRFDQTQHLQIFDAAGHGKDLIEKLANSNRENYAAVSHEWEQETSAKVKPAGPATA